MKDLENIKLLCNYKSFNCTIKLNSPKLTPKSVKARLIDKSQHVKLIYNVCRDSQSEVLMILLTIS